jgi:branched-chain amino acid transport system permease protein
MSEFLIALSSGLGVGSVYALVAIGFSFIYKTTASFNFAQGQLVTLGSLFAYSFFATAHLPWGAALVLTLLIVGLAGGFTERIAIMPLARRGHSTQTWLISTLGIAILITGASERVWGTDALGVPSYLGPAVVRLPDQAYMETPYLIGLIALVLAAIGIELFQRYTVSGRVMRALADNRTAIELAGVNVLRVGLVAYIMGGALAGLAGFIVAPATYAQTTTGFTFAILAFTSFAVGGFSSHWGAVIGGWIVGVVESVSGLYLGLNSQDVIVLGFLICVLLIRPQGLIMSRSRQV